MFIGKEDNVQNQNQVNNNSPYFPSIGMQLSKDASDLGLGNALHWDPEKNTQANQSYMSDDLSNHDIDDDEDSSFDWGDDIDNKCQKRDPTLRFARLARCYHKYCFWHYLSQFMKRVVIAVLGSLIFITIGVCVYIYFPTPTESEKADPRFANVRSNVQLWMYWLAFMWHIAWITTFVIEVIPYLVSKWIKVFRGRRSERFKSYMEYYMSLKLYLGLLINAAWAWGSWALFITYPFSSVQKQPYVSTLWRVFACLFVSTVYLFVQKFVIQVFATRFHRFAFKERIKENKRAIKILDALAKAEYRSFRSPQASNLKNRKRKSGSDFYGMTDGEFYSTSSSSFGPSVPSTSSESNSPTSTLHPDSSTCLKDGTSRNPSSSDILCSFKKNIKKAVINDKPHQSRRLLDNMDINSEDFAKRNAKKLYYCLAYPYGFAPLVNEAHRCLVVADFEPYFHSADEAKRAFDTFDRDSNGDITRREFRDTVLQMYRERKDISISIRDTSQALGKVDLMLLVVTLIAILLTSFAIFNVEVLHSLLPLGSILLAMTFIFGNTAKNTFESMMFLFITHPYDAGDFILIDGNMLLVHNMGIMGTVFISGDGQTIYAPTTVLMTKLITNVRRSGSMGETIKVNIDFNTTTDQYWELHDRLSAWLSGNTRDFGPGFDLRLVDIVDVNQLILNVWLPHKGNWQEIGPRFRRKTRFLLALKDILQELHIQYHLPTQTYTKAPSSSVENTDHQSFHTNQDTTSMDPERARAIENARRERLRRDRNDYSQTGSTTAGGDGGW